MLENPSNLSHLTGADLRQMLGQGLRGYKYLKDTLAPGISIDEARQARLMTAQALRVLILAAFVVFANRFIADAMLESDTALWWCYLIIVPTVATVIVRGVFAVPYAGLVLLPCSVLGLSTRFVDVLTESTVDTENRAMMEIVGRLVLAAMLLPIGAMLDYGVSLTPHRGARMLRRILVGSLGVAAAALPYLGVAPKNAASAGLVTGFLLVAWAAFIGPWEERRQEKTALDVRVLFLLGVRRRLRYISGRVLAIVTISLSAMVLLDSFSLDDALTIGPDTVAFEPSPGAESNERFYYFLEPEHRLLSTADFEKYDFYALADPLELFETVDSDSTESTKAATYGFIAEEHAESLREKLAGQRVADATAFARFLVDNHENGREPLLIARSGIQVHRPVEGSSAPPPLHFAVAHLKLANQALTADNLTAIRSNLPFQRAASIVLAVMAFLLLWRRGGDLHAARWLGLWLAGLSLVSMNNVLILIADSVNVRLYLSGQTVLAKAHGFVYFSGLFLTLLCVSNLAPWCIYRWRRLEVTPDIDQPWFHRRWRTMLAIAVLAGLGTIGVLLAAEVGEDVVLAATMLALVLHPLFILALEIWVRLKESHLGLPPPDRKKRRRLLLLVTIGPVFAILGMVIIGAQEPSLNLAVDGGLAGTTLLLMWFLWELLRNRALAVGDNHDVAYLILGIFVPVMFEISNHVLEVWLHACGLFTIKGAEFAGALAVVLLIQPVHHLVFSFLNWATDRRSQRVRAHAEQLIEDCLLRVDADSVRTCLRSFFSDLGVEHYACLKRTGQREFQPHISTLQTDTTTLILSSELGAHLAQNPRLIKLTDVHLQWEFFFDQFELHRLHQSLGATHLFPVRIGHSLWGLLLFTEPQFEHALNSAPMVETVNNVGLVSGRA